MQKHIAVLPGDGIGPEVTEQALEVLKAVEQAFGHQFSYTHALVGAAAIDATGNPFPPETEQACREADAILFGAIGHPKYDNDPKAKVRPEQGLLAMRRKLGLFANLRPVQSYPALSDMSPLKNDRLEGVDLVVFRELTGGIYFGEPRGRSENGESAFDTCLYSKAEIERIAKLAFEAAQRRRKKLTLVDKANVLATSRLWRETVKAMAPAYPDVTLDFMFVDNAAMKLIQQPAYFDVIVTENMFGDILTDEASVITGSLGMLPSASVGDQVALFEPIHGSYPEAAGQSRANPMAAILSAAMLLEYAFGMAEESQAINQAVEQVLAEGFLTEDLNRTNPQTTQAVGSRIAALVKESVAAKN
ncbi:3-isopropylmalate dehydrogenase [Catalinimonas alkaloidigena]|uniref:3-isopropylmalate dehydrogenase n=1 Tax=Catalinimonas alkaloidigena TaxID=1075417 RepID=A0A1G9LW96_9BACT|nr:3-isopropylmalate dehydrogenase [Catalinimonas alkaloidigena]SDL66173.1 3-isopropylmalate dehydrogenase [Catalinimonas alkaloidigena]